MAKMKVQMILEVMGRPPENVTDALNKLVEKLGNDKSIKILEQNTHPPQAIPDSNDLHTAFSDLTLEIDTIEKYFGILFAYMPSHIEVIEPENLEFSNFDLNDLASKLIHRLHSYDAVTKRMIVEKDLAIQKLKEIAPHLFNEEAPGLESAVKPKKKTTKKTKKKTTKKAPKKKSSKKK